MGTDLTVDEFREKIDGGEITGHVGLDISIAMIAESLRWKLDEIVELPTQPVIAEKTVKTSYTTIKRGRVAGLKSRAYGIRDGEELIDLYFISHASVEEEYDAIEIEGEPKIKVKIEGGVHGDIGTTAMIINAIPKVINAPPGLYTMKDLPIPSATPSDLNTYVKK